MPLFHCTHRELNEGDIIEPGNWGQEIERQGESHGWWHSENILEQVRQDNFPEKPSRLNSTFSCDNLESIMCFRSKSCPNNYVYEVEIIDDKAPKHKGDFNATRPMPRCRFNMTEIAHLYWQYKLKTKVEEWPNVECSEIVTSSALRVISRLSTTD